MNIKRVRRSLSFKNLDLLGKIEDINLDKGLEIVYNLAMSKQCRNPVETMMAITLKVGTRKNPCSRWYPLFKGIVH